MAGMPETAKNLGFKTRRPLIADLRASYVWGCVKSPAFVSSKKASRTMFGQCAKFDNPEEIGIVKFSRCP